MWSQAPFIISSVTDNTEDLLFMGGYRSCYYIRNSNWAKFTYLLVYLKITMRKPGYSNKISIFFKNIYWEECHCFSICKSLDVWFNRWYICFCCNMLLWLKYMGKVWKSSFQIIVDVWDYSKTWQVVIY